MGMSCTNHETNAPLHHQEDNMKTEVGWAWRCQECGYQFRTARAAERASLGDDGCPGCGGTDIDFSLPLVKQSEPTT
jgi:rubrerythrin